MSSSSFVVRGAPAGPSTHVPNPSHALPHSACPLPLPGVRPCADVGDGRQLGMMNGGGLGKHGEGVTAHRDGRARGLIDESSGAWPDWQSSGSLNRPCAISVGVASLPARDQRRSWRASVQRMTRVGVPLGRGGRGHLGSSVDGRDGWRGRERRTQQAGRESQTSGSAWLRSANEWLVGVPMNG